MNSGVSGAAGPGSRGLGTIVWVVLVVAQVLWLAVFGLLRDPVLLVGLSVTGAIGFLILLDPRFALIAIPAITFLFPGDILAEEFIVPVGVNLYAMDWVLLFAGAAALLHPPPPGSLRSSLTPFVLAMLLATLVAAGVGLAAGNSPQAVFADVRLFFYYTGFFITLAFVRSWRDLELVLWTVVIAGSVGALPEVVMSLSASTIDRFTGMQIPFTRITGLHEVNYPLQLVTALALLIAGGSFARRWMLGAATAIAMLALFLSYARGSWAAAAIGILAVFAGRIISASSMRQILRSVLLGGAGLALLLVFLWMAGLISPEALVSRATLTTSERIDISSLARLTEWSHVLDRALEHPWTGLGLGTIFRFYVIGVGPVEQTFVHNSYLYVFSKMGLIGLVPFLALLGTAVLLVWRTLRRLQGSVPHAILVAYGAMLLVFMAKAVTTWHLHTLTSSLFVGLVLGALALADRWSLAADDGGGRPA